MTGIARQIWIAAAGLGIALPGVPAQAESQLALKPATTNDHGGLRIGRYPADSTLKAPVETLKPEQSWAVRSVAALLNADIGQCQELPIEQIVSLPNKADDTVTECMFALSLTIVAETQTFSLVAECVDWIDDAARCSGYGETGAFTLTRDQTENPKAFRLIFPTAITKSSANAAGPDPRTVNGDGDLIRQKYGLFIDSIVDDKEGPKGDIWLVWPGPAVTLSFLR